MPAGYRYGRIQIVKGNDGVTQCLVGGIQLRRKNKGHLIVDGAINADHVGTNEIITNTANIKDATITDAKIANLSAAKITAGSTLSGSVKVSGTALSTVEARAADPAARINAHATQIDPGKILVSGGTTLADWRKGGDLTKIDGGALSANTVSANKLTIGQRGIDLSGISFEANSPTVNKVSWKEGYIRFITDGGGTDSKLIAAGEATYAGSTVYIYWTQGATTLQTDTSYVTATGADKVIVAVYRGGTDLTTNYGQTVIDGDHIKTGAISAQHVVVGGLSEDRLATGLGRNLLTNTDWRDGLGNLSLQGTGGAFSEKANMELREAASWGGSNYPTLRMGQNGGANDGYIDVYWWAINAAGAQDNRVVPVTPGEWYEFAIQVSAHRCDSQAYIEWIKADGNPSTVTRYSGGSKDTFSAGSSTNPDEWSRGSVRAQAPSDAAFARPMYRKWATATNHSNSYLFLHKPIFARTHSGATATVPYSQGGMTVISGGRLMTGTVEAGAVNTNSFNASGLAVFGGDLKSANYAESGGKATAGFKLQQDGTIKAMKVIATDAVRDNAITTTYISSGTGTQSISMSALPNNATVTILAMANAKVVNSGGAPKNGYLRIYRGATQLRSSPAVTAVDRSPTTNTQERNITLSVSEAQYAGNVPTYYAKLEGDADTNETITMLILVTYK
ncbi:MAG: hypothetical protein KDK02_15995 [Rhodobacteraceae bacterium]|nr:hypothetical protein [Paracoccaceae bacterium]